MKLHSELWRTLLESRRLTIGFASLDIIARVFESMDAFPRSESVNREACALLANLVESRPLKEAVLTYGIEKIVRAMDTFPDSVELHKEALRALLCLSVDSEEAKSKLASDTNLNFILGCSRSLSEGHLHC